MFNQLDQLTVESELASHWVPYTSDLRSQVIFIWNNQEKKFFYITVSGHIARE